MFLHGMPTVMENVLKNDLVSDLRQVRDNIVKTPSGKRQTSSVWFRFSANRFHIVTVK